MSVIYEGQNYEVQRDNNGQITEIVKVEYSKTLTGIAIVSFVLVICMSAYDAVKDVIDRVKGIRKVFNGDSEGVSLFFGFTSANIKRGVATLVAVAILVVFWLLRDKTATRTVISEGQMQALKSDPAFARSKSNS